MPELPKKIDSSIYEGLGTPSTDLTDQPSQTMSPSGLDTSIFEGFGDPPEQQAARKVSDTADIKPQEAAKAIKIAKDQGISPTVAHADLDNHERKSFWDEMAGAIKNNPAVLEYANSFPLAGAVSKGDGFNLQHVAETIEKMPGVEGAAARIFGAPIFAPVEALASVEPAIKQYYKDTQADLFSWQNFFATPKFFGRMTGAALTTFGSIAFPEWAVLASAYLEFAQAIGIPKDKASLGLFALAPGRGVPPGGPVPHEYTPFDEVKYLPPPAEAAHEAPGLPPPARIRPSARDKMEAIAEYHQEIEPSEIRTMSDKQLFDYLMRKAGVNEAVQHAHEAGIEVKPGVDKLTDTINIQAGESNQRALDEAFKAVNATLTKERSPDAVEAFLNQRQLLAGKEIWVSPKAIRDLYGSDMPRSDDKILGYVPDLAQKLSDAEVLGTEVYIPRSMFLAHTDEGTYAALRPNIRLESNELTQDEARHFINEAYPTPESIESDKARLAGEAQVAKGEVQKAAVEGDVEAGQVAVKKVEEVEQAQAYNTWLEPIARDERPLPLEEGGAPDVHVPVEYSASDFLPLLETTKARSPVNAGRLAKIQGPKMYGDEAKFVHVALKEMVQNAFDAIKDAIEKRGLQAGRLHIHVDEAARTVTMHDNGIGMTPQILTGPYLEIASSHKESKGSSGSFGLAKMLLHYANKGTKVKTLRDGKLSTLQFDGEFMQAWSDDFSEAMRAGRQPNPDLQPTVHSRPESPADRKAFPEGHGTQIEITVPTDYLDERTGERRPVEFSSYESDYPVLQHSPLFRNIAVTWSSAKYPSLRDTLPMGSGWKKDEHTLFTPFDSEFYSGAIYIKRDPQQFAPYRGTHILSNGIWQFSQSTYLDPMNPSEEIKHIIYVDIVPKGAPTGAGYPFEINRMGFKPNVKDHFSQLLNWMSLQYRHRDFTAAVRTYGDVEYLMPGPAGKVTPTAKVKIEPKAPIVETPATRLTAGEEVEIKDGKLFIKGKELPMLSMKDISAAMPKFEELKIDPGLILPNRVMLHSGMEINEGTKDAPKWVSLTDAARAKWGDRFDKFNFEIGDVFMRLRDAVVREMGPEYELLAKEALGISYHTQYRGVSIRIPFSGSFVNPAGPLFTDPVRAALGTVGTMIHELAHFKIRSHAAEFPAEMQKIQIYLDEMEHVIRETLGVAKAFSLYGAKNALIKTYRENEDIFHWLRELVFEQNEERARPRGLSFKGVGGAHQQTGLGRAYSRVGNLGGRGPDDLAPSFDEIEKGPGSDTRDRLSNPPYVGKGAVAGKQAQLANVLLHAEKRQLYLAALWREKPAWMTQKMWEDWAKILERFDQESYDKAITAAQKEVVKRLTPEWGEKFRQQALAAESDLSSRPDIAANRFLRYGELPTGEVKTPVKLKKSAVEYMSAKGALPGMVSETGSHPDDVAPLFGYATGQELVDALAKFDQDRGKIGPRQYIKQLVTEEANRRLNEQEGSIEQHISDEVQKIAHQNNTIELYNEEMKLIAANAGAMPLTRAMVQDMVEEIFGRTAVKEAKTANYDRAIEKATRETIAALLAEKPLEAFHAAQRRTSAGVAGKLADEFAKFQKAAEKNFKRISDNAKIPGMPDDFNDQLHAILNSLGMSPIYVNRSIPSFTDFVDQNPNVAAASWLYDPSLRRKDIHRDNLTVDEYRDLANTVKSMLHAGREARKVDGVHEKADLDNVELDMIEELSRFPSIPMPDYPTLPQHMMNAIRWLHAQHVFVSRVLDYTDQFNPNNPFSRYIERPLREAANLELKMQEAVTKKLKTLEQYTDPSINDWIQNDKIMFRGQPRALTRRNLRYIGLYAGSKSGMKKLTEGFNIEENDVWDLISMNATENDIKWMNGMWSLFQDIWDRAAPMIERVKGVAPDPIKAVPKDIVLRDGKVHTLTGGYTPVVYDKERGSHAEDILAKQNSKIVQAKLGESPLFAPNYVQAISTPHGYEIPRTEYTGPLDIHGTLMTSKILGMVHDIAFREAVINIRKILLRGKLRAAIKEGWGVSIDNLLNPWLRDIANAQNVDDSYAQGLAHSIAVVRQNVITALTANNIGTIFKHFSSAMGMSLMQVGGRELQGMKAIGLDGFIQTAKDLYKDKSMAPNPDFVAAIKQITADTPEGEAVREFIYNSSPMMRARMRPYWDTVRGAFERAAFAGFRQEYANKREYLANLGRLALAMADFLSAGPEYYVSYKHWLAQTGDHDLAVNQAERAVERAHGSSFIGDRPAILRAGGVGLGGQMIKNMTSLMLFWMHNLNNQMQAMWDIMASFAGREEPGARWFKRDKMDAEYWHGVSIPPLVLRLIVVGLLVPTLTDVAYRMWFSEDKHGFWWHMGHAMPQTVMSGYAYIKELGQFVTEGIEPTFGMIGTLFHYMKMAGIAASQIASGRPSPRALEYMIGLMGMISGAGSIQTGRTIGGLTNLVTGTEHPKDPIEALRLISAGHARRRKVKR